MGTGGASWLCSCADAAACHLLPACHPTAFIKFPSAYYCLLAEESLLQCVFCSHVFQTSKCEVHTQHKRYTEGNLNDGIDKAVSMWQLSKGDLAFLRELTRGRRCPAGHCC